MGSSVSKTKRPPPASRQKAVSSRQPAVGATLSPCRISSFEFRLSGKSNPKSENRKAKSENRKAANERQRPSAVGVQSDVVARDEQLTTDKGQSLTAKPIRQLTGKIENPKSARISLRPVLQLLPYQRRWIEDDAKLKLVVKARQIGYSFAATLRAVLRCLERQTTWIFLSKGERQSRLLMEKVQEHIRSCGLVAQARESTFFEGTLIKQLETRFPNGSVIYGLPANPDTARGYSGNVTLDEFAFHADADKIYAALYPTITRGYGLEVISTPNGTQGKFHELAKAAGLVDKVTGYREQVTGKNLGLHDLPPVTCHLSPVPWSSHWCDIYDAVRQGLKIDLKLLRAGCEDESAWQQEFCCQFVSTAENFFPPDLLAACLSAEASTDTPLLLLASAPGLLPEGSRQSAVGSQQPSAGVATDNGQLTTDDAMQANRQLSIVNRQFLGASPESQVPSPEFFLGMDIGRHHDRTVFWLDEVQPAKLEDRNSKIAHGVTNFEFRISSFDSSIANHKSQITNLSVARLVRTLAKMPFAEQLAFARELLSLLREDGRPLVRRACIDATGMGAPLAEALTREFGHRVEPVVFTAAVKEDLAFRTKRRMEARLTLLPDTREIRRAFSAVKKIVTPSGNLRFDAERTEAGHADEFWAKALADLAADFQPAASHEDAFLADGAPLISPLAFAEVDTRFSIWDF
jgi:phage FluMu gp28-like protein